VLKYGTIEKELRESILSGKFRKGDVLPSESDLCKRYAVSHPTVRAAYQILEEKGLIYREKGRGTFVKFAKKKPASLTIGLVFDRPNDLPFIGTNVHIHARIEGMKQALVAAGHRATLLVVDSERGDYRDLERLPPDGVLDLGNTISPALKRALSAEGIPFIGVSGEAVGRYDDIPYVLTDEAPGAEEAVAHCLAAGYETFGYIGSYPERFQRLDGLLAARGKRLDPEHTFMLPPVPWYNASHLKPAQLALDFVRHRDRHPSLYFFASDEVAFQFAALLTASGGEAGAAFGLVGFGNYEAKAGIPEAECLLSTIHSPAFEGGVAAAELLLERLSGREAGSRTVRSRFIKRKTTR